jgi:hypothetical protein
VANLHVINLHRGFCQSCAFCRLAIFNPNGGTKKNNIILTQTNVIFVIAGINGLCLSFWHNLHLSCEYFGVGLNSLKKKRKTNSY